MILLSQSRLDKPAKNTSSDTDIHGLTAAAKQLGYTLYYIPPEPDCKRSLQEELAHIPAQQTETAAMWSGYIPSAEYYQAVYQEALSKKIRLLNSPEENLRLAELDRAYPYLIGLTPESVCLSGVEGCEACVERLGLRALAGEPAWQRRCQS